MLNCSSLSLVVFTWGGLAGQLGVELTLAEEGQPSSAFVDPVRILEEVDAYSDTARHFRVRNITDDSLQATPNTGEELFALGRAAQNRGMVVSIEHMYGRYQPWFANIPYKIQIMPPSERFTTECNEVWYMIHDLNTPEPKGNLQQFPLIYAHFPKRMIDNGEHVLWLLKAKMRWGMLWEKASAYLLKELI